MSTRAPMAVQVSDPTYGPQLDPREGDVTDVRVDVEPVRWEPLSPAPRDAPELVFVDGVQQVEAWLNVTPHDDPAPVFGVAFAVGAGAVVADGARARVEEIAVQRVVLTEGGRCLHLPTQGGFSWDVRAGGSGDPGSMAARVAGFRRDLEQAIAERMAARDRLVVLDGRLSFLRETKHPVIGAVKSHHAMYLQGEHAGVVTALRAGQRTPLFAIGDDRFGWYQRLPNVGDAGWAGIVRGEVSQGFGLATAQRLADLAACTLPRYAGRPHRDARAPQNMQPIMALEQRLRHRLGDRRLAFRAVRVACAAAVLDDAPSGRAPLRVVA
ncbi:MAG: hypothetical protein KDC33_01795 [Thermoleophilia bacterium]|nr:hypothetical protein [Thermoleophilia bacterium]